MPLLRRGDLAGCYRLFSDSLRAMEPSPFHIVLDLDFTNDPSVFAAHIRDFIGSQSDEFTVSAIYTEMNGFEINTNLWYCDFFAYSAYGGHDDYEWLCDWQSDRFAEMPLTGMESLQAVYDSAAFRNSDFAAACSVSSLIVVTRFQQLVHRAAEQLQQPAIPILSTAHDYEYIAEA